MAVARCGWAVLAAAFLLLAVEAQPPPESECWQVDLFLPSLRLMLAGHNITSMTQCIFAVRRILHLF